MIYIKVAPTALVALTAIPTIYKAAVSDYQKNKLPELSKFWVRQPLLRVDGPVWLGCLFIKLLRMLSNVASRISHKQYKNKNDIIHKNEVQEIR